MKIWVNMGGGELFSADLILQIQSFSYGIRITLLKMANFLKLNYKVRYSTIFQNNSAIIL